MLLPLLSRNKVMTQEDKRILFQDLCARLPYHVRCKIWLEDGTTEEGSLDLEHNYGNVLQDAFYFDKIKDIKPYLRPLLSMTEEEEFELNETRCYTQLTLESYDWLLTHHFDYRNLIEKGLAIEVTKENNPYEN